MNRFEIGKTYTLTGDEPHWTGCTISTQYPHINFPVDAVADGVIFEGDLTFRTENDQMFFVRGDYAVVQSGPTSAKTEQLDMVNHPPHYNGHPKGIEAIEVIEDNPFLNLGNAMKYLWRVSWGSKGKDIEDLDKAIWYIEREKKRRAEAASND